MRSSTSRIKIGARVREIGGRHEGTVRAIVWSMARVVWDDTRWVSDYCPDELELAD